MDEATQRAILATVRRGGSLQAACASRGVEVEDFLQAAAEDDSMFAHLRRSRGLLTGNVLARVYAAAMEGSVPAMSLFLKHAPPPEETEDANASEDDLLRKRRRELEEEFIALDTELRRLAKGDPPPPGGAG